MTDVVVLITTVPSAEVAEEIVTTLVEEQRIACGNITLPVTSIYCWQGQRERASEVMIIMKTTSDAATEASRRLKELHPYDVPEIISLPVAAGHAPYLEWVRESVADSKD